jgi:hypothetical protein
LRRTSAIGYSSTYNYERYHESLNNLTPADVYHERGAKVLDMRKKIKQRTLSERRRIHYQQKVARMTTQMSQILP